ncbi:hypothetical protein HOK021_36040 [Streptomyces hygroscopicus]|nr:hypothetical protein HOK021_36040 [Streptomyces hygroscopicus]
MFRLCERYKRQLGAGHCRSTNAPLTQSSKPLVHRKPSLERGAVTDTVQAGGGRREAGGGRREAGGGRPGAAVARTYAASTTSVTSERTANVQISSSTAYSAMS